MPMSNYTTAEIRKFINMIKRGILKERSNRKPDDGLLLEYVNDSIRFAYDTKTDTITFQSKHFSPAVLTIPDQFDNIADEYNPRTRDVRIYIHEDLSEQHNRCTLTAITIGKCSADELVKIMCDVTCKDECGTDFNDVTKLLLLIDEIYRQHNSDN